MAFEAKKYGHAYKSKTETNEELTSERRFACPVLTIEI